MLAEGIFLLVVIGALTAVYFFFTQEQPKRLTREDVAKLRGTNNQNKSKKKKGKKGAGAGKKQKQKNYSLKPKKGKKVDVKPHPLLLQGYFGHSEEVTAIGFYKKKYVFTASTDQTLRLWKIGAKDMKGSTSASVEGWSMRGACITNCVDGKARVVAQTFGKLHYYQIKKTGGKNTMKRYADCKLDLKSEAVYTKLNSHGTFVLVVGHGIIDPRFKIINCSGTTTYYEDKVSEGHLVQACLSPCERWFAIVGGMQSVNLWHITSKDGVFIDCRRALQLRGHKSSVTCVTFSPNCTKALTSSEDGKVRIFHIDVRWKDREDPKLVDEIEVGHPVDYAVMSTKHVCACSGTKMFIFDLSTKKLLDTIPNVQHLANGKVRGMEFSEDEMFVLVGGTDKHAYLYSMPK